MPEPPLPLLRAWRHGGSTAATVALLRALGIEWSVPDPSEPLELLGLLRSAEVNPSIRGTQDILLGEDDVDPTGTIEELASGPDPIVIIAEENQWLWQAHVIEGPSGEAVARIINEETDEHFGDLDLGHFLLRMMATTVTAASAPPRDRLVERRVTSIDPDRLVGPDRVDLPRFHLADLGLGDGWFVTSWTDPTRGSIWTLAGSEAEPRLDAGRREAGGRWFEPPAGGATSPGAGPGR